VELDPEMAKIPNHFKKAYIGETLLAFNQAIIESTLSFTVAYKIDKKFYEKHYGGAGITAFCATVSWLKSRNPEVLLVTDSKCDVTDDIALRIAKYRRALTKIYGDFRNTIYEVDAMNVEEARKLMPKHFLLVNGVRNEAIAEVAKQGLMEDGGLLINFSQSIIHADATEKFAYVAMQKAHDLQQEMQKLLLSF
jgi:hypothetical protein